ncbi:MAG TPA: SAM-dependent methyltransferase [Chloroflexota bacterium]|nr:SAM-dependent methyltransferase [Chloroflexota bacterium]
MLRVRAIEGAAHLKATLELFERVYPGAMTGNGRNGRHFQALQGRPEAVLLAAEDRDSVLGAFLSTPGKHGPLYFDVAVAPGEDAARITARLLEAAVPAARDRGHISLMTAAARDDAEGYQGAGFVPTLLVQLEGEQRFARRQSLLRDLPDRRPLRLSEYGPAAQAWLRVDRVDLALHDHLWRPEEGQWAQFMMHRWASLERRPRYVVTFHDRFLRPAVADLRDVDPELETRQRLHGGVLEVQAGRPGHDLPPAFQARAPLFVQHLAPATQVVQLDGTTADLERLRECAMGLESLRRAIPFAVECRKGRQTASGPHEATAYTVRDVEIRVGSALEAAGFEVDRHTPGQVVSIYLTGSRALVGVAGSDASLTTWADQARRRGAQAPLVSRAEHKLAEALELFRVELRPGQRALDLGAAPGGWSHFLAERGVDVLAVDPAALDPRVETHPRVRHLRARAEALPLPQAAFDLLVNDMVMDPADSARIMCAAAPSLKPHGVAIMTLKLPYRRPEPSIRRAREALAPAFDVLAIRHLPHNRQEVTALLKPLPRYQEAP